MLKLIFKNFENLKDVLGLYKNILSLSGLNGVL